MRVAFVGNPNTGKSTVFNRLTRSQVQVGNFAGTTVERSEADWDLGDRVVRAVDVPGTYSLAARSPEEAIAIDTVLGLRGEEAPDLVVVLVDSVRLVRSLYLALQLLDLPVPVVVAVGLLDEARRQGVVPDLDALHADLQVPVIGIVGRTGEGLDQLTAAVRAGLDDPASCMPGPRHGFTDALDADADEVASHLPAELARLGRPLGRWALLSLDDAGAELPISRDVVVHVLDRAHAEGRDVVAELVGLRYTWLDARSDRWRGEGGVQTPLGTAIDRVLLHPVVGPVVFLLVMGTMFTALFSWADPMIGLVEQAFTVLGDAVAAGFDAVGDGAALGLVRDLVVEGGIQGVGAVLVFLPQIALLFLFLAILEDSGYLARAAFLMDRLLRRAGLPGVAFVPLLSGYACAVPAILATRTLPRRRDRLLTMLVLPLTSCSARLPVYTLIIAALFPATVAGFPLPVRPAALLFMYLLSTATTVAAAIVLGRLVVPAPRDPTLIELVPYRVPSARAVFGSAWRSSRMFVREAGGVILIATVVLWGLLTFPRVDGDALRAAGATDAEVAAQALEHSLGGQMGHAIEPVIRPLGFDWRMGVGIVGAFAAREVFVSTMGLVYGIGDVDEDSPALRDRIREDRASDGTRTWTPLVGASLMVFFAFAMQCTSTLAVLVQETRSWRWPAFVFVYMTTLAWVSSFLVYQGGLLLGFE